VESRVTDSASVGSLYVVSTPIGNMGDFSFRAVEVLKSVDAILAEDTRHTRNLLTRYEIATPTIALAIVSDAGTPLLSDPGSRLIHAAIEAGVRVVPIPGASAMLAALVASGLEVGRFTFFGFLTRTGSERRSALDEISSLRHTAVVYESANRLAATLIDLEQRGIGGRPAVVAREMTKQFEEVRRGTLSDLRAYYEGTPPRGELVLLIGAGTPTQVSEDAVRDRVQALRGEGMSSRDAAAQVARELGVSKRLAYQMAQEPGMKAQDSDE
jgi:16S rRNA (cytidine1402-2'-O)-methyltransferase